MTLNTAILGFTIWVSLRISPKPLMPISTTDTWCPSSRRSSVHGTPSSLLKFFSVRWVLNRWLSTAEIISLVVVLPTLPVMPITGMLKRLRCQAARAPMALRDESTTMAGRSPSPGSRSVTQATAPFFRHAAMKSWPSTRLPLKATNSAPAPAVRLSLVTEVTTLSSAVGSPT